MQRVLIFFGILFALWLIVYIAFRTPPVQRYVTGLIGEQLSKQLDTKVTLEGIDIDWIEGVELAGVYVEDQQQDTLLYAGLVAAYINPSALLNSTAYIRLVEVRDTYINLYQPEGQEDLNFAFIPEAFASSDTTATPEDTTASSWKIELYQVQLDDIRLDYQAEGTEVAMALDELSMFFESLGLDESFIQGDELTVDGLQLALALPPTDTSATAVADTTATVTTPPSNESAVDSSNIINPSGFRYALNELLLENSRIAYRVKGGEDTTMQQINFEDLVADQLNLAAQDIYVGETEVKLQIPQFSFVETNSGFRLAELAVATDIDMPRVAARLTALETNNSTLNGGLELSMTLADNTAELVRSIALESELDEAVIGLADAGYFTNALDSMPIVRELSPQLSWQVSMAEGDGNIQELMLDMGEKAQLRINGSFRNIAAALDSPTTESPYLDIEVPEFTADLGFVEQLTPPTSRQYIPQTDDPALALTASIEGYLNDLNAETTLRSGVGRLAANTHYVQKTDYTDIQTTLTADNFNLKQVLLPFVGDTLARSFGQLSFRADADVRQRTVVGDTSLQRADVELVVGKLAYNDYLYQDLILKTNMVGDAIEANVRYEDSLLNLTADLATNLAQETYQADVRLKNANLLRLNLLSDSLIITNSRLQADIQGTDPDKITGFVKLADTEVVKGRRTYAQDSILFTAEDTNDGRLLTLAADRMEAVISGQFSVAELPQAFEDFQQYYFAASPVTEARVDTVNTQEVGGQRVKLRLEVAQTPKLAEAFVPELDIPEPMSVEADFNSATNSLEFRTDVPRLAYGTNVVDSLFLNARTNERKIDMLFFANNVQASGLTIPEVRLEGTMSSEAQDQAGSQAPLSATVANFNLKLGRSDSPYRLDLTSQVRNRADSIVVLLDSLELMVKDDLWDIPRNAQITYAENYLDIQDFYLKQGNQEIALLTEQESGSTTLKVAIEQLLLEPLLAAFDMEDYRVSGTLGGQATVQEMFTPGPIDADFRVNQLAVADTLLGDLSLEVQKDVPASDTDDRMDIALSLKGESNDLEVVGEYNVLAPPEVESLDFRVDMNRLTLGRWQPLAQDVFKELSGTLRADMTISGTASKPIIDGNFTFADQVIFTPVMTGARLYVEEQSIAFTGDQMQLDNFTLLDSARSPAVIDGTVSFADLTNPQLDLSLETEDFQLVSSDEYENEEFYGRAVASASLTMSGPVDAVTVQGEVAAEAGTDMTIALIDGPEEAARADYIQFVDVSAFARADTVLQDSLKNTTPPEETEADSVENNGYQYALDILVKVDPEAQFTTIVDPVNGDRLVVAGEADLQVNQRLGGDLTMQGTYVVTRGSYLLTFAKVVKKEFTIRDGSSLTWSGDVVNAQMDMTAVYTVEDADIESLAGPQAAGAEGSANVLLFISGYLESPELSFDLEIPNIESLGPLVAQAVQEKIDEMQQNETQLYKNVFGLIVLGRFLPPGAGLADGGGGGGAGAVANEQINSSVSQLLTSQLSKISEQYLGGVEIDVGLESNETGSGGVAGRDVDVAVSRDLFNERVSVSVGGTTTGGQGGGGGGFAGEFEVLYRITEDGNLNLKAFQSTERNPLTNQLDEDAGISLLYRNSFDNFFAGELEDETLKSRSLENQEPEGKGTSPSPAGERTSERRQRRGNR